MKRNMIRLLSLVPMAAAGAAQAHPGHAEGAMAGLAHPFMGADHLLAMVAVGIWAAQLGGKARWLVPASFVALMAAGGAFGMAGLGMPLVEGGIATSVLLFGLLIAFAVKVSAAAGAALVGLFALCHGFAHGAEMPQSSVAWQYAAGFMVASALLHAGGFAVSLGLRRQAGWLRAGGALIALGGAWLMAAV